MKLREFFFGLFVGMAIISLMAWAAKPKEAEAMTVAPVNGDYVAYTQQIEHKYNIKPNLLVAICTKESNWQNVRGTHGEIGVCQVKPASVAHMLGKRPDTMRPVLYRGSIGPLVRIVQNKVGASIDGRYGTNTVLLVAKYQSDNKLRVDGIVGAQTWASLLGPPNYTELLWNQRENIEYAGKYLAWLRDTLETDNSAILMAAYNGGPGHPVVKYMVSVEQYRESLMPSNEAYIPGDLL